MDLSTTKPQLHHKPAAPPALMTRYYISQHIPFPTNEMKVNDQFTQISLHMQLTVDVNFLKAFSLASVD